jgi:hypothetical protein
VPGRGESIEGLRWMTSAIVHDHEDFYDCDYDCYYDGREVGEGGGRSDGVACSMVRLSQQGIKPNCNNYDANDFHQEHLLTCWGRVGGGERESAIP